MIVVLDTNALLVAIPQKSIYRPIFDALLKGSFDLILSNDILSEYVEVLQRKANAIVAHNIAEMLINLKNVKKVDVYFEWKLIVSDPDDNKYVDAAIVGAVDYIVTNDLHFKILKSVKFPKVEVITIEQFLNLIVKK